MARFGLQERSLDLQGQQLEAQMAHAEKMAQFELDLQKIEDERFKTNYENMMKQIEEELKLEPLRQEAIKADLAYQAARLSNAQLMWDNELAYMEKLKEEIVAVIREWEALNKIKGFGNGSSNNGAAPLQCPACGQTFPDAAGLEAHYVANPSHRNIRASSSVPVSTEQSMLSGYTSATGGSSQPVTVNFILDGEVIMSTVVTPERLRPVVQEVDQRNRRR